MPLLLIFVAVPVIEIYLLLKVGSIIGIGSTIALIILTAVVGTILLKQQGFAMLARYQQSVQQGKIPAQEMIESLALMFGGALLLTPGFFTDAIGFLCLFPFTRVPLVRGIMKRFGRHMQVRAAGFGRAPGDDGRVFDDHTPQDKDRID